jgi:AGCS family alanine or glycine:cation symporter
MLTWSYYGEQAWHYLFGKRSLPVYYIIFSSLTFLGGLVNLGAVVDFGDLVLLAMAIPNLIAVFVLRHTIRDHIEAYVARMKSE